MTVVIWTDFPKYRFLRKISYTRPGAIAPEQFVLAMDVRYNNRMAAALEPVAADTG
jgi:hypothetical protein